MHRGGFAHVYKNSIRIPRHYLHPLSLDNSSVLSGLYYPRPTNYSKEIFKNFGHDFIFSPIPFDLWPFLCRITIRMKDDKGSLAKISKVLSDNGINILVSDFHQAGHRYLHWSIIGEFYEIRQKYHRKRYYAYQTCIRRKEEGLKDTFEYYQLGDSKVKNAFVHKKFNDRYERLENIINDQINEEFFGYKKKSKHEKGYKPKMSLEKRIRELCDNELFEFDESENEIRFDGKKLSELLKQKRSHITFGNQKKIGQQKIYLEKLNFQS